MVTVFGGGPWEQRPCPTPEKKGNKVPWFKISQLLHERRTRKIFPSP